MKASLAWCGTDLLCWLRRRPGPRTALAPVSRRYDLAVSVFILIWDGTDDGWPPDMYAAAVQDTAAGRVVREPWSTGTRHGGAAAGDRVFLYRQQPEHGIVAAGRLVDGTIRQRAHCRHADTLAWSTDVTWDQVLDLDDRLAMETLQARVPAVHWARIQSSGQQVNPPADADLEQLWATHLATVGRRPAQHRGPAGHGTDGVTSALDDARRMLRRLVGVELTTLGGQPNTILSVDSDAVLVATRRSPGGKPVAVELVAQALWRLRSQGSILITPEQIGYRSAFVGAVLRTIAGAAVSTAPAPITLDEPEPASDDSGQGFVGDLHKEIT